MLFSVATNLVATFIFFTQIIVRNNTKYNMQKCSYRTFNNHQKQNNNKWAKVSELS